MALSRGTLLGPYEILAPLGVGGMGEVYRGHDTKLHRDVAIKVLLPAVANDPDRLARFGREAQVLAALNHPNIAHIHGLEESGGILALVMELVEGEDLSQRIARGALPLDEALPIARQIAEALDAAHEQGIIHRDLKPANIKVRPDGVVKVLDFGLAKALDPAGGSSTDAMNSPTLTAHATRMGVILGTAAYMSPEQARGKSVDKRADIWAFGVVVFEMLTGRRAFEGEMASDVLAKLIEREPDWTALDGSVPPRLRELLRRCLKKDPKARLRDVGEARLWIDELLSGVTEETGPAVIPVAAGTVSEPVPAPRGRSALARLAPWLVTVLVAGVAAAGWLYPRLARPSQPSLEVSTEEFEKILTQEQAIVLDARPHLEYSISHIPGALNVAARPGVPMSMYVSDVAEVGRLVGGDMNRAIVLYCNGPHCSKSKRLMNELMDAGYTNVRRYQLGIPVWRAVGGVTAIEVDGLRHVLSLDRTAVVIDVREADAYRGGTLPGARHVPRSGVLGGKDIGEIRKAKDDGRLPMEDHNTRIIVVGRTAGDARFVAQAIADEAFHNVAYFPGTFEEAKAALAP
jgi:rhodanese-related sulfurtransferase